MPSITDSIGRVLGDRYRLVTALGTGASAHVYLADDVSLHRRVAIKVLHPALAGDAAFLKRFRAEARAVAALNHPNILQVYDWGEQDGTPYLVLEYLAGGSLRQVEDTGTLLTPEQAVKVGVQAAAGLDYAHRRGLVHRDIKPANLLFGDDSRLRIADFGLARALAEAAWTEPDGAVLGTARYAAPEQVEGWALDGKADVYALAIVLYEAVTGEAPFTGDTTVATMMARVGTLLPEHPALGPLNEVLVWAAAPEADERYDAATLVRRLDELAPTLPPPASLPLVEPDTTEHEPERLDVDRALVWPTRGPAISTDDRTMLGVPAALAPDKADKKADKRAEKKDEPGGAAGDGEAPLPHRRRRLWPWLVAAGVLVAALLAGGGVYAAHEQFFTPSHPVPALAGSTVAEAQHAVAADKFTVHQQGLAYSITVPTGRIIRQSPGPARPGHPVTAKQGATIDVVVSKGLPPVAIPANLTSFTNCNDAIQALANVHLVGACPPSVAQYSSTVKAGAVLGSVPAKSAPYGSTVSIIISKGHAPVSIPAFPAGTTYAQAAAALTAAGLVPAQNNEYSNASPAGQVISTNPDPSIGPVAYDSTVTVNVSLGPKPVIVTNVMNMPVAAATAALQAQGLQVSVFGPPKAKKVVFQSPAAGTSVLPGTVVTLDTI